MSLENLRRRIERLEKEQRQRCEQKCSTNSARVKEAISSTHGWVTQYTKTYNEHWVEEGRPSPYEPFPSDDAYPHLYYLFELLEADERIVFIEKSRDMMVSWDASPTSP